MNKQNNHNNHTKGPEKVKNNPSRRKKLLAGALGLGMLTATIAETTVTNTVSTQPDSITATSPTTDFLPSQTGNGETSLMPAKGGSNQEKVSPETNEYLTDIQRNNALKEYKRAVAETAIKNGKRLKLEVSDVETGEETNLDSPVDPKTFKAGYVWVRSDFGNGSPSINFMIRNTGKGPDYTDIPALFVNSGSDQDGSNTSASISTDKGTEISEAVKVEMPSLYSGGELLDEAHPQRGAMNEYSSEYPTEGVSPQKYEENILGILTNDITQVFNRAGVSDYPVTINLPTTS